MGTEAEGQGAEAGSEQGKGSKPEPSLQSVVERVRAKAAEETKAKITAEAKQGASDAGGSHTPAAAGSTPASATDDDEEALSPAEQRVAGLTGKLKDLEARVVAAEKAAEEKVNELLARLKKNPAKVLKDHEVSWSTLAEDFERLETPGAMAASEAEAKLQKRIDELEASLKRDATDKQQAAAMEMQAKAHAAAGEALAEGKEQWPIASRKENAEEAARDALRRANKRAGEILEKRKASGDDRPISGKLAQKLIANAFDKVEAKLADRGKRYAPPEPKPVRRGLSSSVPSVGGSSRVVTPPRSTDLSVQKQELLARVRRATRPET